MKTSNKLIISAVFLILAALVAYDFFIKKVYDSGVYKLPYQGFITLPYKNFDRVDLSSSTAANAKFVQGPFSVRIDQNALEYTQVSQEGNQLQVAAVFEGNYLGNPNAYTLIISCPDLAAVNANATYRSDNRQVTDTIVRDDWKMRQVLIEGFTQDSLHIEQDYGSTVVLANNTIRSVDAVIGKSKGSGSIIITRAGNRFGNFSLAAGNVSKFILENADIQRLTYQPADGAKLILSGNARHLLNNLKNQPK